MLVDQPFIGVSEDRSTAANDFNSQKMNEFIFPKEKATSAMKRTIDSTSEDEFIVIGKRAKEGKVLNPDFS
jgi:hypothetical protein